MGVQPKRHSRRAAGLSTSTQREIIRTTLIVTDVLNRNLEIYCALNGMSKNDGVVKLITDQLSAEGFKPDQYPKEVNYA